MRRSWAHVRATDEWGSGHGIAMKVLRDADNSRERWKRLGFALSQKEEIESDVTALFPYINIIWRERWIIICLIPSEEAEEENSLICCREYFAWVLGITLTQAHLAKGLQQAAPPPSPESSSAAHEGHPTCALLHPRTTSAGIPPTRLFCNPPEVIQQQAKTQQAFRFHNHVAAAWRWTGPLNWGASSVQAISATSMRSICKHLLSGGSKGSAVQDSVTPQITASHTQHFYSLLLQFGQLHYLSRLLIHVPFPGTTRFAG